MSNIIYQCVCKQVRLRFSVKICLRTLRLRFSVKICLRTLTRHANRTLSSAVQLFCTIKAYLCCFTQFTVDQSKLTVNGSVLSDTPNVRYLVALYHAIKFYITNHLQPCSR